MMYEEWLDERIDSLERNASAFEHARAAWESRYLTLLECQARALNQIRPRDIEGFDREYKAFLRSQKATPERAVTLQKPFDQAVALLLRFRKHLAALPIHSD